MTFCSICNLHENKTLPNTLHVLNLGTTDLISIHFTKMRTENWLAHITWCHKKLIQEFVRPGHPFHLCSRTNTETEKWYCQPSPQSVLLVQNNLTQFRPRWRKPCKMILALFEWDVRSTHEMCYSTRRRKIFGCFQPALVRHVEVQFSHCNRLHHSTNRTIRSRWWKYVYRRWTEYYHSDLGSATDYCDTLMTEIYDRPARNKRNQRLN